MKKVIIGILAHVDAGKTTLSEALLYGSGSIRKLGRVDNKDAFLDTYALERERGITIFSKQAQLKVQDLELTLLDTPGHVDFSAEMERTLQVLDYAILVISGADGVQGHTQTLWQLLQRYQIPVFLFFNKMDQNGTDKAALLAETKRRLNDGCVCFDDGLTEQFYEEAAMGDEDALEYFLEEGHLEAEMIGRLILERKIFPCYFGSALKLLGVDTLMEGIRKYSQAPVYPAEFGAKVFKITRDEQGKRLTHMKITGGELKVRSVLENGREHVTEKVNQLRIYSGEKYETVNEIPAGNICSVTGLSGAYPGEGLGAEKLSEKPVLEPVLTYQVILPEDSDAAQVLPKLRQMEEEEPELRIVWDEVLQEILVQLMGEVQIEVLKTLIAERYSVKVDFGKGNIVYKETITDKVEGVGHFEPLRHYAEVHLILEPGDAGSGMQFASACSADMLDRNWQRLILTHLQEREYPGVLTGSPITDMKITLVAGRAHYKHTEGGDFRQATYRAVRQGLKETKSVLLEPFYEYRLEIPDQMVGRAIADIERMHGSFDGPFIEDGMAVLCGSAPVCNMRDYQTEVSAYSKGHGRLFCTLKGYEPCHNEDEVRERIGYDSERDAANPTGSVFCSHGAGFHVPWDRVKEYMHIESRLEKRERPQKAPDALSALGGTYKEERRIDTEEIDAILDKTSHANRRSGFIPHKGIKRGNRRKREEDYGGPVTRSFKKAEVLEEYLLVDGYNIIYAWDDLKELAGVSIDGARGKLQDILCNYQALRKCHLIVVFDAYRVQGHNTEILDYHNIHVVFTKEAETADEYIEKFAHQNRSKYNVAVATSDGLEQIIIRGQGSALLSAQDLKWEIDQAGERLAEEYQELRETGRTYLLDGISEETAKQVRAAWEDEDA